MGKESKEHFNHGEAYRLMKYADTVTGNIEIIWNSRDGVTPFCETSKEGNEAQHIDWKGDEFSRFHVPAIGDRIFMTATHAMVEDRAKEYVDSSWNHSQYPMKEMFEDIEGDDDAKKAAAYERFTREFVDGGDQPWLVVVDERLHEMFNKQMFNFKQGQEIQQSFKDLC